ncbi:hypothetical protein C0991_001990 [Blastosporella zonata]|nr:hypothetical protein C0991_001990 [Blastosporella zonata]
MDKEIAHDAFERARKSYIELLTAKERTQLEAPTSLSDLLTKAEIIGQAFKASRTQLTQRLKDASTKLQPFERILEGLVKLSPHGGDLIWGSVSFILEMARNNADMFNETMDFFLTIADEIDYVKLLETTFCDAPLVVSVIESLYSSILGFWVKAVKHYRPKPSRRARIFSGISNLISSSYMHQKFQSLKAEILAQKDRLHRVASAQHFASSALYHQQSQREAGTALRQRLVQWINAPSYDTDLHSAQKKYYVGTCEWMAKKPKYTEWISRKETPILVVYGIPGAGKTILSSWLINQATSRAVDNQDIVLYHFFKASDDSRCTSLAAIRSLIDQLYEHLHQNRHPLLARLESELETLSTKKQVSYSQLWAIFTSLVPQFNAAPSSTSTIVTIIVDAMDECKNSKEFVRDLYKQVHAASGAIRVVVTSRKSGNHVTEFTRAPLNRAAILEITTDDVKRDIAIYTKYKITKIERLQGEIHRNLRNSVIMELGKAENHQGMFLWSYLMCKEVKRALQVSAIWHLLKNLPKGLDAMYAQICSRLAINETLYEFGRSVLQWIVTSSRPLRFAELEQALKTQATVKDSVTSDFFEHQVFFDEEYGLGLLWSRKDIVEACGDLVSYTGLDDGDMIGLIHLSVRNFLCSDPKQLQDLPTNLVPSLSPFLVDIPRAESQLGATCLEYLLGEAVCSDPYFQRPVGLEPRQSSHQDVIKRHPFLDYSLLYWAEYASNTFMLSPAVEDIGILTSKTLLFIAHPLSVIWLEEYIRQLGIEPLVHIVRRLSQLSIHNVPKELLLWAAEVGETLDRYYTTLRIYPSAIRICLSLPRGHQNVFQLRCQGIVNVDHYSNKSSSPSTTLHLEMSARGWLHHDPITDNLFSVDNLSKSLVSLKCQVLSTGMRFRPAVLEDHTVFQERIGKDINFFHRSSAVSPRMGFIATTFTSLMPMRGNPPRLTTICWSLATGVASPSGQWAQVAVVEHLVGAQLSKFEFYSHLGSSIVAFGADNTLITPGGIWDLVTEERSDGPASIFNSDPKLDVINTCFSGNGKRVARIIGHSVVEVLDLLGHSICTTEFPLPFVPQHLCISYTGRKILVEKGPLVDTADPDLFEDVVNHYTCFDTEDMMHISVSLPTDCGPMAYPQFTKDEEKLVSCISSSRAATHTTPQSSEERTISIIAIWSFVKNDQNRYLDHAPMLYLFKTFDDGSTKFCLTRTLAVGSRISYDNLVVVKRSGAVYQRRLDTEWSQFEERELLESPSVKFRPNSDIAGEVVVKRALGPLEWVSCLRTSPPIVEQWSLGPQQITRVSTISLPLPTTRGYTCRFSATGNYLAIVDFKKAHRPHLLGFYQIKTSDQEPAAPSVLPLDPPFAYSDTNVLDLDFSADDSRIAILHSKGGQHVLSIFDIASGGMSKGHTSQPLGVILSRLLDFGTPFVQPEDPVASHSTIRFSEFRSDLLVMSYCTDDRLRLGFVVLVALKNDNLEFTRVGGVYFPLLGYVFSLTASSQTNISQGRGSRVVDSISTAKRH